MLDSKAVNSLKVHGVESGCVIIRLQPPSLGYLIQTEIPPVRMQFLDSGNKAQLSLSHTVAPARRFNQHLSSIFATNERTLEVI